MSAPDLTKKVIGYRYWVESEGALNSQGHTAWTWGRGVQEARCDKHGGGMGMVYSTSWGHMPELSAPCAEAPGHGCSCGLHAYHEPPEKVTRGPFQNPGTHILGVVRAWGRMEVHRNGFRAQFAEILCLGYNPLWPQSVIDRVKELARGYEVDCVPLDQLKTFAEAHGAPVPEDLRPEPSQAGVPSLSSHMAAMRHYHQLQQAAITPLLSSSAFRVSAGSIQPMPKRPSILAEILRFMAVWVAIYVPLATAALLLGAGPWTPLAMVPAFLIFWKMPRRIRHWITPLEAES